MPGETAELTYWLMTSIKFQWPSGIRMFEIVPRESFVHYNKEPGIAVFSDVAADGTETVLHIREFERFYDHAKSVLEIPAIKHRGNIVALVSETPPPVQDKSLDAFKNWFTSIKLEVQQAKQMLNPVVKD